jgi:3-oxoacyl-ACP reductase-like protein
MGSIRARNLKEGGTRYQAEVHLKGHPILTATFDRKTDAQAWIQKVKSDIRAGRHHLYAESKKHTFKEAVKKYLQENTTSEAKQGHLNWWSKELGTLYLQDIRPSIISAKKTKVTYRFK